jgi:aspartyl-tRNA(Asn)/glutamyl-tRNA(Gln) amidotransferase subunit B
MVNPKIGVEVHVQLRTKSKLFCDCPNLVFSLDSEVNSAICPICLGLPGVLPTINEAALKLAILVGIAIDSKIPEVCKFARKNYFYPDLPKGYQISQYEEPLGIGGKLPVFIFDEKNKNLEWQEVHFRRLNLEEDAAKFIHLEDSTLVDFNRCGIPLLEMVTEPELTSASQTKAFLEQLRCLLLYLEVSDCSMEKGSFRVDVNVSLQEKGFNRIEIKNLNSFAAVEEAINYELNRLATQPQEEKRAVTRLWDEKEKRTKELRRKEESHDYRYFPEPDLLPLNLSEFYEKIELKEELPWQKLLRFQEEYASLLSLKEIIMLTQERDLADLFERLVGLLGYKKVKSISNWLLNELRGLDSFSPKEIIKNTILQRELAELIYNVEEGRLVRLKAKEYLPLLLKGSCRTKDIIEKEGVFLTQQVEEVVKEVIRLQKEAVEEYKQGKTKVLGFLVGEVMRKTAKRANPKEVEKLLLKSLSNLKNDG